MVTITRLAVVSDCAVSYLVCLIASVVNVKYLTTGSSTHIDDTSFSFAMAFNKLQELEELRVAKSDGLSARMLYYLVDHIPKLREIRNIEFWHSVSASVCSFLCKIYIFDIDNLGTITYRDRMKTVLSFQELALFRDFLHRENLDVDTGEPDFSAYSLDPIGRRSTTYWSRQLHSLQSS